jgi:hypothetical protein
VTRPYSTLIREELDWMSETCVDWGTLLVDPDTVTVSDENPALKRLFSESGLNNNDPDHWKLLLAALGAIVYAPRQGGSGRPAKWKPQDDLSLARACYDVRLRDLSLSILVICESLCEQHELYKKYTPEYLRERLYNWLAKFRPKVERVVDHHSYRLNEPGKLHRDVMWVLSPQGKAELKRRT